MRLTNKTIILLSLFVLASACKKDPVSNNKTVTRIDFLTNGRDEYQNSYLYSTLKGKYYYSNGRLDSIREKKSDPHEYAYGLRSFTYSNDGKLLKLLGICLHSEWNGPKTKNFFYDPQGRVVSMKASINSKDDILGGYEIKYDSLGRINEYTEIFWGAWSRTFYYKWKGENISQVKIVLLDLYPNSPNIVEAIVKFEYDNKPNPFIQENYYLFRPRYLSANNPIIDTTYKYIYDNNSVFDAVLLGIDTIVNNYTNTYNSKNQLTTICKNGDLIDVINYGEFPIQ